MLKLIIFATLLNSALANNLQVANSIAENEPVGTEAANLDNMLRGSVYGVGERIYQLVETKLSSSSSPVDELFQLEGSRLVIRKPIDREAICPKVDKCTLETSIFVVQTSPKQLEFMLVVETTVRDVNDNEPVFAVGSTYRMNVTEGDLAGTKYPLPEAVDRDSATFGMKNYTLEGPAESLSFFRLKTKRQGGLVRDPTLELLKPLDREIIPHLQMRLVAADNGKPALKSTLTIDLQVADENDNTPQFEKMEYLESLEENYDLNGIVANVRATDSDSGDNARISYFVDDSANPQSQRGIFVIPNPNVGQIRLAKPLDYEQWPEHRFKVVAVDNGKMPRTGSTLVTIRVIDVNDQPPAVVTYPTIPNKANEIRIKENSPVHTAVAVIKIKEADGATSQQVQANAKNVECHIQKQEIPRSFYLVAIEKGTEYILKSNSTFDREFKDTIDVQVQCVNQLEAGSRLATNRDITVYIIDENDNAPIFEKGTYQVVSFPENSPPGAKVHKFVVTDPDGGPNSKVTFSLEQPRDSQEVLPFAIHPEFGSVSVTDVLDRETVESYSLKVIARDNGEPQMSTTATLVVKLVDENDNDPIFEQKVYNFLIPSDVKAPYRITQFSVTDADKGDNAVMSLSIEDAQNAPLAAFSLEPNGAFYLRQSLPESFWSQRQNEPLVVKMAATDSGSPRRRKGTAMVRLYLVSKADSSLLMLFPTKSNFSLPVSISLLKSALGLNSLYPPQMVTPPAIGQVVAVTDDNYISQGAYVTYELLNSNSNQKQQQAIPGATPILFKINKTTGAIYVDTAAMAAASRQQQQVPVIVNPGDRYSLAVVIRLSVPPFNKTFAIERFNRLDIVFQDNQLINDGIVNQIGAGGLSITTDLQSIGVVVGLSVFAGFGALLVLVLVVICCRKKAASRNGLLRTCASGMLGPKSLKTPNAKSLGGCSTGNTSPCGSNSSKQTSDTKPLSVDIMTPSLSKQNLRNTASNFENSMFPVDRLKFSGATIDEEIVRTEGCYSVGTMRRANQSKVSGLVGVATPRLNQRVMTPPGELNATTTSPLSEVSATADASVSKQNRPPVLRQNAVTQESSSSSIVSNSSTQSGISTGVSSSSQQPTNVGSNDHDGSSGRGTEEPPSAPGSVNTVPRSILVMKSPMPPPRPSGLFSGAPHGNIAQYHVYPRVPPGGQRLPQMPSESTDESISTTFRLTSPESGANYFAYSNRQHHSEHYLMSTDGGSSDDMAAMSCNPPHGHLPPSSSTGIVGLGGCPVHGGAYEPQQQQQAPPVPPPMTSGPFRNCPVHGHVISVGTEATFSPTSILRNHHNAMMTGGGGAHHHQHPHGTML